MAMTAEQKNILTRAGAYTAAGLILLASFFGMKKCSKGQECPDCDPVKQEVVVPEQPTTVIVTVENENSNVNNADAATVNQNASSSTNVNATAGNNATVNVNVINKNSNVNNAAQEKAVVKPTPKPTPKPVVKEDDCGCDETQNNCDSCVIITRVVRTRTYFQR